MSDQFHQYVLLDVAKELSSIAHRSILHARYNYIIFGEQRLIPSKLRHFVSEHISREYSFHVG